MPVAFVILTFPRFTSPVTVFSVMPSVPLFVELMLSNVTNAVSGSMNTARHSVVLMAPLVFVSWNVVLFRVRVDIQARAVGVPNVDAS